MNNNKSLECPGPVRMFLLSDSSFLTVVAVILPTACFLAFYSVSCSSTPLPAEDTPRVAVSAIFRSREYSLASGSSDWFSTSRKLTGTFSLSLLVVI